MQDEPLHIVPTSQHKLLVHSEAGHEKVLATHEYCIDPPLTL